MLALLLPVAALAQPVYLEDRVPQLLERLPELELPGEAVQVVGGDPVNHDDWADVAAVVFYGQYVGCTGTLVAPDVVITAAHCADGISHVLLDTTDYETNAGEMIAVSRIHVHPSYYSGGYDVAALELSRAASVAPRPIATDCVRDEALYDGADVAVVGYGALNEQGTQYSSKLQEGFTTIDDAECDQAYADGVYMGCAPSINPGGEIGAGGDGVDACFGDSGGPLYLLTDDGSAWLTGITSRAYAGIDPNYPCRDGGIFVRADAVMGWVETVTGAELPRPACNQPPEVSTPPLVVAAGDTEVASLSVHDDGEAFSVTLVQAPSHGTLELVAGEARYTADADYEGPDTFVIEVVDDGSPYPASPPAAVQHTVEVTVVGDGGSDALTGPFPSTNDGADASAARGAPGSPEPAVVYRRLGRTCAVAPTPGLPAAGSWLVLTVLGTRRRRC
jgi:hypothetical protein